MSPDTVPTKRSPAFPIILNVSPSPLGPPWSILDLHMSQDLYTWGPQLPIILNVRPFPPGTSSWGHPRSSYAPRSPAFPIILNVSLPPGLFHRLRQMVHKALSLVLSPTLSAQGPIHWPSKVLDPNVYPNNGPNPGTTVSWSPAQQDKAQSRPSPDGRSPPYHNPRWGHVIQLISYLDWYWKIIGGFQGL